MKVVDFKRGVFAVTPRPRTRLSEDALRAAVDRSGFQIERVVPPRGGSPSRGSRGSPPAPTDNLARAREAFRKRRYQEALQQLLARTARKSQDDSAEGQRDAAKHNGRTGETEQLLSLIYFALGKYDDAAAAAHAALHATRPWDWQTLKTYYPTAADYASHLRSLEQSIRKQPTPQKRFLVGYHYLMLGQARAAQAQFAQVAKENPDDKLVARLLRDLDKNKRAPRD